MALTSTTGVFVQAAIFGPWFKRWCARNALPGNQPGELALGGRLEKMVLHKMIPLEQLDQDWRTSVLTRDDGDAIVWARHAGSVGDALQQMWASVYEALLFSGTLAWSSSCGVRSTSIMTRRLCTPPERSQDLGRVHPAWRDAGVCVRLPEQHLGEDGRLWLGAYRDRKATWRQEVANVLRHISRSGKTLVLLTSYDDVQAIAEELIDVPGVCSSQRGDPVDIGANQLSTHGNWCWLATGAAWTGLDLDYPLTRLAIGTLPLPDPTAMRLLACPQDAVFDAVSRMRQGIGRLVRGAQSPVQQREIMVLDGRVNDTTAVWRHICQPFLQVLGEDFETHQRFTKT
jgi:CRISPR type IV-associated DEAD/DEAH-box helicase Csf4